VAMGAELNDFLSASRPVGDGLRVVFAGAVPVEGPGELMRIDRVGPSGIRLIRVRFNDGRIVGRAEGMEPSGAVPLTFALHPNAPNPFNPETTIRFELPQAVSVRLEVFDVLGQQVRVLVAGELPTGVHQVVWDGRNGAAIAVGNSVYFYRLQAGEFNLEPLVAPQAYGKSVYYSYIIVPRDSEVESFEGLRGKVFAFTDPQSNTGCLVPNYMLARMDETPESFFKEHFYSYAHDESIKAVAQKVADGAAVDSLIWDYADKTNPEFTSQTKIIQTSPPYGIPPIAVRPGLDPDIKQKLKEAFLQAHNDPPGKKLLDSMMIEKFVELDDSLYDSVREMKVWVAKKKASEKK